MDSSYWVPRLSDPEGFRGHGHCPNCGHQMRTDLPRRTPSDLAHGWPHDEMKCECGGASGRGLR